MKQRHITRLTPADQRFDLPIPSPDNQQILIRRIDDGDQALALLDRETGDITTILKGIVDNPRWSPDGQVIALNHWEDGTVSLITVSLTTDKQVVVAENPVLDYAPTWSPDGKQIAYIGIDSDQPQYNTLYVVDASGKSSSQRIVERISRAGSPSSGLSWQPDGDKP
jgi:TolB protein